MGSYDTRGGHPLSPDVTDPLCEQCGRDPYYCICPECPTCGVQGGCEPWCHTEPTKEWAAREAPLWSTKVWEGLNEPELCDDGHPAYVLGLVTWVSDGGYEPRDGTWMATDKGAAGLAYRDKVAAELDEARQRTLLWVAGFEHGVRWMSGAALSLGLIVDAGYLTDFGREIARILEGRG